MLTRVCFHLCGVFFCVAGTGHVRTHTFVSLKAKTGNDIFLFSFFCYCSCFPFKPCPMLPKSALPAGGPASKQGMDVRVVNWKPAATVGTPHATRVLRFRNTALQRPLGSAQERVLPPSPAPADLTLPHLPAPLSQPAMPFLLSRSLRKQDLADTR